MNSQVWRALIITSVLVGASACSGKRNGEVIAGAAGTPEAPQQQTESVASDNDASAPRLKLKDLNALVDLVVAEAKDLPRAEFDPAALAAKLGKNPQAHFEWVRDHTWWAPYRGLLRGSQGVMLDRVGSSLDRAVLLGDLLRHSGYTVRLAHAQLSEQAARDLLSKVGPIPERHSEPGAALAANENRERLAKSIIPSLVQSLHEMNVDSKRRLDEGAALVRSQTDQLYALVKDAASAGNNKITDSAAIAALRDHWWVELEDNGKWVAMDVLTPDAKPGVTLAKSAQTSEWGESSAAPAITADEWHTVQIRVVVERYLAGDTSESTVLETTVRPAEVFDRPIAIAHVAKPWPEKLYFATANSNALREAALNVRVWTPVLRVGSKIITQSGFTESGDIKTRPFDPTGDIGGGGLFSGLDSALGGGVEHEPYASAEWIDYEIRAPGQESQRVRRQLFDLLGPGRRLARDPDFNGNAENRRLERSEALLSRTDILLQPCDFTNAFIQHLGTAGIVTEQTAFRELSREGDREKRRNKALAILGRMDIWGRVLDFTSWRSALGSQRGDWFIDRTNVINLRTSQRLAAEEQPSTRLLIDIGANPVEIRRGASSNPFRVRLERGVADTVAEILARGDISMAENTAAVFDMSGAVQSSGLLIAPRDSAAVSRLSWPDDETARIGEDVNAGFIAVALRRPVELGGVQRVGWWRVDPTSGETVGVMDSGFHQAMVEDKLTRSQGAAFVIGFPTSVISACVLISFAIWDNWHSACFGEKIPPPKKPPPPAHGPRTGPRP